MVEHLFKAFHRGHVRRNAEGLGLGLFIASVIAEAHGDTIDVHSDTRKRGLLFGGPSTDTASGEAERSNS
jgi:phosphoserine phosphatase RsbU/P